MRGLGINKITATTLLPAVPAIFFLGDTAGEQGGSEYMSPLLAAESYTYDQTSSHLGRGAMKLLIITSPGDTVPESVEAWSVEKVNGGMELLNEELRKIGGTKLPPLDTEDVYAYPYTPSGVDTRFERCFTQQDLDTAQAHVPNRYPGMTLGLMVPGGKTEACDSGLGYVDSAATFQKATGTIFFSSKEYVNEPTTAHELGHYLGLGHYASAKCVVDMSGPLSDAKAGDISDIFGGSGKGDTCIFPKDSNGHNDPYGSKDSIMGDAGSSMKNNPNKPLLTTAELNRVSPDDYPLITLSTTDYGFYQVGFDDGPMGIKFNLEGKDHVLNKVVNGEARDLMFTINPRYRSDRSSSNCGRLEDGTRCTLQIAASYGSNTSDIKNIFGFLPRSQSHEPEFSQDGTVQRVRTTIYCDESLGIEVEHIIDMDLIGKNPDVHAFRVKPLD